MAVTINAPMRTNGPIPAKMPSFIVTTSINKRATDDLNTHTHPPLWWCPSLLKKIRVENISTVYFLLFFHVKFILFVRKLQISAHNLCLYTNINATYILTIFGTNDLYARETSRSVVSDEKALKKSLFKEDFRSRRNTKKITFYTHA